MLKKIVLVLIICSTFQSCSGQKKSVLKENNLIEIYFVPNNMTTYNLGKATFRKEYAEYGMKTSTSDTLFVNSLDRELKKPHQKRVSRTGLRIKLVINKKDSLFFPYLPRAPFRYNKESYSGSPELLHLVLSKIKEKYSNGDFVCEGSRCKQEVDQGNISFMNVILKNCEEYINKED